MAESTQPKLRKRVAEAVRVWDGLPSADRRYKNVAERMNITEGRAAVYVRDGLVALGRGDETPRGNSQGSGSGSGVGVRQVSDFEAQLQSLVERNREVAEQLGTEVSEAQEAAASFDAEKYVAEEMERLEKAVTEAQERLVAWSENTDDVATKAAEGEGKRLQDRADSLTENSGKQIDTATAAADQAEAFLATLVEQAEAAQSAVEAAADSPAEGNEDETQVEEEVTAE